MHTPADQLVLRLSVALHHAIEARDYLDGAAELVRHPKRADDVRSAFDFADTLERRLRLLLEWIPAP